MGELNRAKLGGAQLQGANLSGAQLNGANFSAGIDDDEFLLEEESVSAADLSYSRMFGSPELPMVLRSTDLSGITISGGALRFVDLRSAVFSSPTDFRNAFGDATVLLPIPDDDRPCHWPRRALSDEEFYARWRGWLKLAPDAPTWNFIAPPEWHSVEPVLPDDYPACTW